MREENEKLKRNVRHVEDRSKKNSEYSDRTPSEACTSISSDINAGTMAFHKVKATLKALAIEAHQLSSTTTTFDTVCETDSGSGRCSEGEDSTELKEKYASTNEERDNNSEEEESCVYSEEGSHDDIDYDDGNHTKESDDGSLNSGDSGCSGCFIDARYLSSSSTC